VAYLVPPFLSVPTFLQSALETLPLIARLLRDSVDEFVQLQ
jgi:hypothetical protein